jgi:hypothetical protein
LRNKKHPRPIRDVLSKVFDDLMWSFDTPTLLACIAHKSLEIFERCRLWQQNSPATPDNFAAFSERTISNSLF